MQQGSGRRRGVQPYGRAAAITVLGSIFGAAAARADEALPFREAWGWAVVLQVEVAGAGRHEFLVDTGSARTILEPGLAAALAGDVSPAESTLTLAGEQQADTLRVGLALGSWRLRDVEVHVAPLPAIRIDEPGIRGILGQSALKHLEYTIDHARRRFTVHQSAAVNAGPGASRPVVEARLGCGPSSSRLVIDSGIAAPVLFERSDRPLDLPLGPPIEALTNGGRAVWREARVPSVCVAGRRTAPLPVVVRPKAEPPREEDGLLPSRFFSRVRVGPAGTVLSFDFW